MVYPHIWRLISAHRTAGCDVVVVGKDSTGAKLEFIQPFRPYFYAPAEEQVDSPCIKDEEFGFVGIDGTDLKRVYLRNPSDTPAIRDLFSRHYEADVIYSRRALVDWKIINGFDDELRPCTPPDVPISVIFMDCEMYQRGENMPESSTDQITCITLTDGKRIDSFLLDDIDFHTLEGTEYVGRFTSEKELLRFVADYLSYHWPDVITGWHIVSFDMEYLKARCAHHGIPLDLSGINFFDLLTAYRRLYRQRSYRLKDIALAEGLTDKPEEQVRYGELWEKDKEALLARNQNHARWICAIDKKHRIVEYHWALKEMCGQEDLEHTLYPSVLIDTMLLRRTFAPLPSRVEREHVPYEGAYVSEPPKGVFESVANYDLSRFYPSLILNECLDPAIFLAYPQRPVDWDNGYRPFAQNYLAQGKPTLLLGLVREMLAERDKLQAAGHTEKVMAIKAIVNSLYGALAYPAFRLFMPEITERITQKAREIIKSLAGEIKGWGFAVLYSDTDNCWVQVPKSGLESLGERINDALRKRGDYHMKLEAWYKAALFTGDKKRYAVLAENGDVSIVGFEHVKSDSSNCTRKVQETILKMLLEGRRDAIIPYLQEAIAKIKEVSLQDVAVARTLSKEPDEYGKEPETQQMETLLQKPDDVPKQAVQGYIKAALEIGATKGEAVWMLPVKGSPYGVVVFRDISELPKDIEVDWDEVVDKQIKAKVESLLPLANLDWAEVQGQRRLL